MKVGLVMIVKDEEHIIERNLRSTLPIVDTYVIIDTGSTDNTIAVINKVAKELNKDGIVYKRKWVNFGVNRTEALNLSRGFCDWAFMIDADDFIEGDLQHIDKTSRGHHVIIDNGLVQHSRSHLFNLKYPWKYVGAVHEYPCIDNPVTDTTIINGLRIHSRTEGNRSKNENRFKIDAIMLKKELENNKNCDVARTLFYLAQSYRDSEDFTNAVKYYKKREEYDNGWYDERYISCLNIIRLVDNLEEKIKYAWKAQSHNKERKEAPYEVLSYCRKNLIYREDVYAMCTLYKDYSANYKGLFVENIAYTWKYWDELGLYAYYTGRYQDSYNFFKIALETVDDHNRNRVNENIQFALNNLPIASS